MLFTFISITYGLVKQVYMEASSLHGNVHAVGAAAYPDTIVSYSCNFFITLARLDVKLRIGIFYWM
jgi:hypothetical protein